MIIYFSLDVNEVCSVCRSGGGSNLAHVSRALNDAILGIKMPFLQIVELVEKNSTTKNRVGSDVCRCFLRLNFWIKSVSWECG